MANSDCIRRRLAIRLARPAPLYLLSAFSLALFPSGPAEAQGSRERVTIEKVALPGRANYVPQGASAIFAVSRSSPSGRELTVRLRTWEPLHNMGSRGNPTDVTHNVHFRRDERRVLVYVRVQGATNGGLHGTLEAFRMLIPPTITTRRTRRYTSTLYIHGTIRNVDYDPYRWQRAVQFATAKCQRLPARTGHFTYAVYTPHFSVFNPRAAAFAFGVLAVTWSGSVWRGLLSARPRCP